MNRAQYRRARCVLQGDKACAQAGHYYSYRKGETCAIGALAIDAGVKPSYFRHESRNDTPIFASTLEKVSDAIEETFGLALGEQERLQSVNDGYRKEATQEERRAGVLRELRALYENGK